MHTFDGATRQAHAAGEITCVPVNLVEPAIPGQLNVNNAPGVIQTLQTAHDLVLAGDVDAIITGPVQKRDQ